MCVCVCIYIYIYIFLLLIFCSLFLGNVFIYKGQNMLFVDELDDGCRAEINLDSTG